MTCRQVRALADEMAAGKSSPESEARARAHAVDCDACAIVMERAVAFRRLLDAAKADMEPPPDLVARVRERIVTERIRPRLAEALGYVVRLPLPRAAAVAAVAVLLLFVGWHAFAPAPTPSIGPSLGTSRPLVTAQAGLAPEVADALETAAASNESEDLLFADMGVIEVARAQASGEAASCLDM